jgi:hypothetical protein
VNLPNCVICRAPERARLIEADWAGGLSATAIAATMTEAGWPITAATVLSHLKKHVPYAATRQNVPAGLSRRDTTVFIQTRILDEVELREKAFRMALEEAGDNEEAIKEAMRNRPNILDKDIQPALNTALKAEAIIVKREDNTARRKIDLFQLMLGGADGKGMLAPQGLIGSGQEEEDEDATEGEFEEVPDGEAT